MAKVDTLVVDKTGTLTEGKPKLTQVLAAEGFGEADVLRMAASLEKASEHPLASAILAGAQDRGIEAAPASDFSSVTGRGVQGTVEGRPVAIGNAALLASVGVPAASIPASADSLRREGQTVMLVAIDGRFAGLIGVADPVKASTPDAIRDLKAAGLRILMVTGDNRDTAEGIAKRLGIEFEADVLPEGKAQVIKRLQDSGAIVAMAGDGVNDAPALAQAQVGIAMGTGTDVAIESSGITLLHGDLSGILKARRLSQSTLRTSARIFSSLLFTMHWEFRWLPESSIPRPACCSIP